MLTISPSRAAEKQSRRPVAPDSAWLTLLGRLPAPLTDLRDPSDQAALATATRRGAIRLMLGLGGEVIVARRRP